VDITDTRSSPPAEAAVTLLYTGHALGLVRLAVLLVGDRASAEDIVQDDVRGALRRDQPWELHPTADSAGHRVRRLVAAVPPPPPPPVWLP